ncbi:MAG: hypothetical protein HY059_14760 [Proteobacteria bacterium]|nr:hypothetical protein [Pseudomonadota bacterium]
MIGRVFAGFAWAGFMIWSLLCLGLWGAVTLGGDLLRWLAGAALSPGSGEAVVSALRFLEAFGTALLAWIWLAGSVLIAVAGIVLRRVAANATMVQMTTIRTGEFEVREMKDVTPPEPAIDPDAKRLPPR